MLKAKSDGSTEWVDESGGGSEYAKFDTFADFEAAKSTLKAGTEVYIVNDERMPSGGGGGSSAPISADNGNALTTGTDKGLYVPDLAPNISSAYNPSKSYTVGEYCIYLNELYKCIANTTAGILPTNTTYFVKTTMDAEFREVNSNMEWKLVGSAANNNPISLPDKFNEISVRVTLNKQAWIYNIPYGLIPQSTYLNFVCGGSHTTDTSDVKVHIQGKSLYLAFCSVDGVDYSQSGGTSTVVFYR